ncbi:hypothetical protein OF83DRAFT_1177783 [Amylostereum chailletii]|nr:hypothetical protein OF83DRAFT_1177783 [Amylostereum chailletii]
MWAPASVGDAHPHLPSHCLTILPNGFPSWVTKKTVKTYRGREKLVYRSVEKVEE